MSDITPIPAGTSEPVAVTTPTAEGGEPISTDPNNPVAPVVEPNGEDEQATLDKRLKGAIASVEKTNDVIKG